MSETTGIGWTDSTWTPLQAIRRDTGKRGCACVKVSPGCKNCYSETMQLRNLPKHGTGLEFTVLNLAKVDIVINEEILLQPLKWKKPRMIFANSQTDTWGDFVEWEQIDLMMAVAAMASGHTFQFLTKRADRLFEYMNHEGTAQRIAELVMLYRFTRDFNSTYEFDAREADLEEWPLPNVWLGISAENQEWADKRIPFLLRTPAAVKFVSFEPLLGPVNADRGRCDIHDRNELAEDDDGAEFCCECAADGRSGELSYGHWLDPLNSGISWAIVGGESGHGARQMRVEWIESIIDQCRESGTACFVKQLGAYPIWAGAKCAPIEPARGKCDKPEEWPESLRVQEFPAQPADGGGK